LLLTAHAVAGQPGYSPDLNFPSGQTAQTAAEAATFGPSASSAAAIKEIVAEGEKESRDSSGKQLLSCHSHCGPISAVPLIAEACIKALRLNTTVTALMSVPFLVAVPPPQSS